MLSDKAKAEIRECLKKYANKRSACMDALRIAQAEASNNITKAAMEDIADMLGMNPAEVNAVATFYTMYNVKRPVGKYHIQVCRNLPCSLMGAEHLIKHMEDVLGIKTGATTPDNKFTLKTVECLGSCGTAPMMQINDDFYENLDAEKIDGILKGLK